MSEFISVCPKCRQQILCDTNYIGKRVACPVCLQEITMPEPTQQRTPGGADSPAAGPATSQVPAKGKQDLTVVIAVIVAILLVAGAGVIWFGIHNSSTPPASGPMAGATAPAPAATAPPPATSSTTPSAPAAAAVPAPNTATAPATAGAGEKCRSIWSCNQGSGKTVVDSSGNGNDAMLAGDNAMWTKSGPTGNGALSLDGTNFAEVAVPVINTAQSFTAAGWVNIAATDKRYNQTIVSIDGDEVSGFFLMLNSMKTPPRFSFTRYPGDRGTSVRAMAEGNPNPALNTWYHVAGVYDADAQTISLYVNGKKQSTVPCSQAWQAKGKTAIGRGFFSHKNCDFVNGMISDVRLYSTALSAAQIQALAGQGSSE